MAVEDQHDQQKQEQEYLTTTNNLVLAIFLHSVLL